jgi:hypothetical protein
MQYIYKNSHIFYKAPQVIEPLRRFVGHAIIISEEAENRKFRRFLTPGLTETALRENHIPVMWRKTHQMKDLLLQQLPDVGQKTTIDMAIWLPRASMDIIGLCGFGHDFDNLGKHDNPFSIAWGKVFAAGQDPDIWLVLAMLHPIFFNLVSWNA